MAYIKKKVNFIWSIYDRGENRWSIYKSGNGGLNFIWSVYKRDNPTPNTLNPPQKKIPRPYPVFFHSITSYHVYSATFI